MSCCRQWSPIQLKWIRSSLHNPHLYYSFRLSMIKYIPGHIYICKVEKRLESHFDKFLFFFNSAYTVRHQISSLFMAMAIKLKVVISTGIRIPYQNYSLHSSSIKESTDIIITGIANIYLGLAQLKGN